MRAFALLLVLVAAVAGCGGGDDALSEDDYRAEARKICADAQKATSAVEQPTRTTNEAIASYFTRLVAVNRRTTERFEDLEPPEKFQDAHDDALKANRDGVEEVQRLVKELEGGGDPREVLQGAQARLTELSRASGDAAKRLGVPECAREE